MPWLNRHAAWVWSAVLLTGLALVVAIRLTPGVPNPTSASPSSENRGIIAGDSGSLVGAAQQIRTLQEETGRIREQLAAAQADLSERQLRISTLDAMLASNSLTDCPPFLREDTTVRALQKIIREAHESQGPFVPTQGSLNTAATVAEERLRSRIESLRNQAALETNTLGAQAETLRQRLRIADDELERLQGQVRKQLQSRTSPRPTSAT